MTKKLTMYVHCAIIYNVMRKGWKVWQTERNYDIRSTPLGIVQVDGIKPSDEFLELVEKEKRGEITSEDIRKALYQKYKVKEVK